MNKPKNKKQNLEKNVTLGDLYVFTEEVLLPATQGMVDDLEQKLGKRIDKVERKLTIKEDLDDLEGRLQSRFVTKDYLDKKLFELEGRIVERILKEKKTLRDAVILVMEIVRQDKKPTKKQLESLKFLEKQLAGF